MKSFKSFSKLALALCLLCFVSCSKTNNVDAPTAITSTDSITGILTSGTWIISSMTEQKQDNTQSFAGYTFTFAAGGKLSATKNGIETPGSWHYTPAVTYYGSSSNSAIAISMGTDNPFRRLSKTWNLTAASSVIVKLDNPEVLEEEHLQFQKK